MYREVLRLIAGWWGHTVEGWEEVGRMFLSVSHITPVEGASLIPD